MNGNPTIIETELSPQELMEKLRSMTITEFSQIRKSPAAVYYGAVTSYTFDIRNVNYGPMSPFPGIQGDIQEGVNKTVINVKMCIVEQYLMAKKLYYGSLFPIGIITFLLSMVVLGGTEYQMHGFIFSSALTLCPVMAVMFTKRSLMRAKLRELQSFTERIGGSIIDA